MASRDTRALRSLSDERRDKQQERGIKLGDHTAVFPGELSSARVPDFFSFGIRTALSRARRA